MYPPKGDLPGNAGVEDIVWSIVKAIAVLKHGQGLTNLVEHNGITWWRCDPLLSDLAL